MYKVSSGRIKRSIAVCMVAILSVLSSCCSCSIKFNGVNGGRHYYDDTAIAGKDEYNARDFNGHLDDTRRVYSCEIGKLDGVYQIASAEIQSDCNIEINVSISANSGKIKLVLVKPSSKDVEVLKEVIAGENSSYTGDISLKCTSGVNVIKMVGADFCGNLKITQYESIFRYSNDETPSEVFPIL